MGDDNLYFQNLPGDMTAETISQIFGAIGYTVVQANITKQPRMNTCAAEVQFQSAGEAKFVLDTFNGTTLPGFDKPLNISYVNNQENSGASALAAGLAAALMAMGGGGGYGKAPAAKAAMLGMQGSMQPYAKPAKTGDPDNLYIKGLPGTADEAFVEQLFNQYGTVRQCKVMKKSNDQPTCHAMVRFATAEDAATVIGTLNGGMLEGFSTPLEISYLVYKPKGAGKGGSGGMMGGAGGMGGDPDTQHLLDEWLKAKRTRDFSTADAIRATLRAQGVDPDTERPKWEGAEDMSSMK